MLHKRKRLAKHQDFSNSNYMTPGDFEGTNSAFDGLKNVKITVLDREELLKKE